MTTDDDDHSCEPGTTPAPLSTPVIIPAVPGGGDEPLDYETLARELGLLDRESAKRLRFVRDGLLTGRWVVFVGAGVSCGAGLPSWDQLARELADVYDVTCPARIADNAYPTILADCLRQAPDAAHFWREIALRVCGGEPTEMHALVMRLPFQACLTTNFDCLLEAAHATLSDVDNPPVMSYPALKPLDVAGRRLVHLHGRCEHRDGEAQLTEESTVLTAHAYEHAYSDTPLATTIEGAIESYEFLLVGASLGDWQIRQLLSRVKERAQRLARSEGRGTPSIRGYALVEADADASKTAAADYSWSGLAHGLKPIFYVNPDRTHISLQNCVRWLVQETGPASSKRTYEA
jgi:SIR2-like domain